MDDATPYAPERFRTDASDVAKIYNLFLGRMPESEAVVDLYVGRDLLDAIASVVASVEFREIVYPNLVGDHAPTPELLDRAPAASLIEWCHRRLPLTQHSRDAVAIAADLGTVLLAVIRDPDVRRFLSEAPDVPPNVDRAARPARLVATAEDVANLYQFFLGRPPETPTLDAHPIGSDMATALGHFIHSQEFGESVQKALLRGLRPRGAGFGALPAAALLTWAGRRLPLSDEGRLAMTEAHTWLGAYSIVFSDPGMAAITGDRHPLGRLCGSAITEDSLNLHRLLLGRDPDLFDECVGGGGGGIIEQAFEVIASEDYMVRYRSRPDEPLSWGGSVSESSRLAGLRDWVARRLPLTMSSRRRLADASTLQAVLDTLFRDAEFYRALADLAVARWHDAGWLPIGVQVMLVDAAGVFDRAWYLGNHPSLARSGDDPLEHYIRHGMDEGRDPNRAFDTLWYCMANPATRRRRLNPLVHYLIAGVHEGSAPHPFFPEKAEDAVDREWPTPLARVLNTLVPSGAVTLPLCGEYDRIRAIEELEWEGARRDVHRHMEVMSYRPQFVVAIDTSNGRPYDDTLASLSRQVYRDYETIVVREDLARLVPPSSRGNRYLLCIAGGDRLRPEALYEIASALNADRSIDLCYFDEDRIEDDGRVTTPFYKPAWSPDYLESMNYVGNCVCFRLESVAGLLGVATSIYDLVLRFTETPRAIRHIEKVLVSCQGVAAERVSDRQARDLAALSGRLARTGRNGDPVPHDPMSLAYNTRVRSADRPLVSIVIPTAGKVVDHQGRALNLIVNCLESISHWSTYDALEIVIVDSGNLDRRSLDHLSALNPIFLTRAEPDVNVAAKINAGCAAASGEYLLILNDDTMPLVPDWIEAMLGHFEKPHVGMVGAKLFYPDMSVQHVGMVHCDGVPEHVNRLAAADDRGYFYGNSVARNYASVTGAVAMVRTDTFRQLGGLDEQFPIEYNDVDFCFRLAERGYTILCEPEARLIHFESMSAVREPRPWDTEYYERKWAHLLRDPYYDEFHLDKRPALSIVAFSQRTH